MLASTDLDTRTGEYKVYFDCKVCKAEGVRHERVALIFQPCFYCGVVGTNFKRTERKDGLGSFYYNGLDRVDSRKGYISNNVVSCCKVCNRAKSDMSLYDFQAWLEQLINHTERQQ